MTTQAAVQAHVWRGYGIAAKNLGAACPWYRPSGSGNPIAPANSRGTLMAAFDSKSDFKFSAPSKFGNPLWYGLFDATLAKVGDYLSEPRLGMFFIASIEPLHAPLCIGCNQVVTITRPGRQTPGPTYYGGGAASTMQPIAAGWPAAVVMSPKGETGEAKLPGDSRQGWLMIYLPASLPIDPTPSDIVTDGEEIPNRYVVSVVENTQLGWRLHVRAAST